MTKTTTTAALALIKAIAALEFRAMDENDFATFAGAEDDAQIAFAGEDFAFAVCDAFGDALLTDEGNTIAVIVSGERIEVCAMDPNGDPKAYTLDLARAL